MKNSSTTEELAYLARVQSQIDQFADQPIHDLPEIFHVWSHNSILPGLKAVYGVNTINDFYLEAVREASDGYTRPARVLSIGCGDGTVEIELAQSLLAAGMRDFRFDAIDLSPVLIERFAEKVGELGLQANVFPSVQDMNAINVPQTYDVILANHCLHHIVDLEKVFDFINTALSDTGIFATSDMIGRNGHMRWPEVEAVLQVIWPLLSEKQRFHHQLLRADLERFQDHDCSTEGFEGIRAQDILHLLLNRFNPYKFLAFGGFADVLVDRGYGHGFNPDNAWDREFILAAARLNDLMLDSGMIKPTSMIAYFTKDDRGSSYYRDRTALSSLRHPYETPAWVRHVEAS